MRKAVIIFGPPGSGKGTQSEYIIKELGGGLVEYDTGQRMRDLIAAGIIDDQGHSQGKLNDPNMVREIIKKDIGEIIQQDKGVVFTGSPRSIVEAFGDRGQEGLIDFLEREYGKDNLIFFSIEIPLEESIKRNLIRGEGRVDDDPEVIRRRYEDQYLKSVVPTIQEVKKRGFHVVRIDGVPSRPEVFVQIKQHLETLGLKAGY